jgi:hypothetical protein
VNRDDTAVMEADSEDRATDKMKNGKKEFFFLNIYPT